MAAVAMAVAKMGAPVACTTKELYTDKWHYTISDTSDCRDFTVKQAHTDVNTMDCGIGPFEQSRYFDKWHYTVTDTAGVKHHIGVNKMDCDPAEYLQLRYDVADSSFLSMLAVGLNMDWHGVVDFDADLAKNCAVT